MLRYDGTFGGTVARWFNVGRCNALQDVKTMGFLGDDGTFGKTVCCMIKYFVRCKHEGPLRYDVSDGVAMPVRRGMMRGYRWEIYYCEC